MSEAELNGMVAALRELLPATALDRDRLMFDAGQAARPSGWGWPLATALVSLLAVVLAVFLFLFAAAPVPPPVPSYAPTPIRPHPTPPAPDQPETGMGGPGMGIPADGSAEPEWPASPYYQMQDQLLRWGLDGLQQPPPGPPAGHQPTAQELLQALELSGN